MKRKILLLAPAQKQLYSGKIPYPPLGLLCLSSVLESNGFETELVQEDLFSKNNLLQKLNQKDVLSVFATSTTALFPRIQKIASELKINQGPPVMLGGPHATSYGKDSLTEGIVAAVQGEGETTAVNLAFKLYENSDISGLKGVVTREKSNPLPDFINDLDTLPFPNYGKVKDWKVFKPPESKSSPAIPVSFSRGCTGNCVFCSTPSVWGKKVRRMTTDRALELIEYAVSEYKAKEIHITDDDFSGDRDWTEDFLFMLRKKKLPVSFFFMNGIRPSNIDRDLLRQLKHSNFLNAGYGIETSDKEIFSKIGKSVSIKKYEEAIKLSSEEGLTTWVFYIFGLPGETRETVEKDVLHAISSKAHFAKFFILQPYKGTRIHRIYSKMKIIGRGPQKGLYESAGLQLPGFSPGEMEKMLKKAYLKFYSNPATIFRILKVSRNFSAGSFFSDFKFVLKMMRG
ncbi:B12-binding domain-containing radical SAM protein [candidate division WOR-3 bacterium]|nr:B12-binding domain-containing radical SAM protein [candidate division WOR-3 bacterium]